MMDIVEQYKILHQTTPSYGAGGGQYLSEVRLFIDYLKPTSVLDFGCGKESLIRKLAHHYPQIEFYGYDPAIPGRDTLPIEKADLIITTDVLEHIPEDALPDVVETMASISDHVFAVLHHALAERILSSGTNAHCTVKPPQWYYELFGRYFNTPHPLPGRNPCLSALITFPLPGKIMRDYHRIVAEPTRLQKIWNEIQYRFTKCSTDAF